MRGHPKRGPEGTGPPRTEHARRKAPPGADTPRARASRVRRAGGGGHTFEDVNRQNFNFDGNYKPTDPRHSTSPSTRSTQPRTPAAGEGTEPGWKHRTEGSRVPSRSSPSFGRPFPWPRCPRGPTERKPTSHLWRPARGSSPASPQAALLGANRSPRRPPGAPVPPHRATLCRRHHRPPPWLGLCSLRPLGVL